MASKKKVAALALSVATAIGIVATLIFVRGFQEGVSGGESLTLGSGANRSLEQPPPTAGAAVGEERPSAQVEAPFGAQASLWGYVRTDGGAPVPGATVTAIPWADWEQTFLRMERVAMDSPYRGIDKRHDRERVASRARSFHQEVATLRETFTRTRSGMDGSYALFGLKIGQYRLLAGHTEYLQDDLDVSVKVGKSTSADLFLHQGDAIAGTVFDPAGNPVADVSLRATPSAERLLGGPDHSILRMVQVWREARFMGANRDAQSDADGRFRLGPLLPGHYDIHAQRRGFPDLRLEEVRAGASDVEVWLLPGIDVSGRVRDATGKSVGGALIILERRADDGGMRSATTGVSQPGLEERSRSDGVFEFKGLSMGEFVLRIETEELPTYEVDLRIQAESVDLGDIVLSAAQSIVGRVVGPEGVPGASAEVWF